MLKRQSRALRFPVILPLVLALGLLPTLRVAAHDRALAGLTEPSPAALSSTADGDLRAEQWPGARLGTPAATAACFPQETVAPEPIGVSPPRPSPDAPTLPANLMALMPSNNLGQTVQAHPTLFWYLPQTTARYAQFNLYEADIALRPGDLLYRSRFRIQGNAGVVSLSLPPDLGIPALEIDRPYIWQIQIYCGSNQQTRDPQLLDTHLDRTAPVSSTLVANPASDPQIEGILWRVEAGSELLTSVAGMDPLTLYQQTDLWWDAVAALMAEYCNIRSGGDRLQFEQRWQDLLQAVDLAMLAQAPIAIACE